MSLSLHSKDSGNKEYSWNIPNLSVHRWSCPRCCHDPWLRSTHEEENGWSPQEASTSRLLTYLLKAQYPHTIHHGKIKDRFSWRFGKKIYAIFLLISKRHILNSKCIFSVRHHSLSHTINKCKDLYYHIKKWFNMVLWER